MTTPSTEPSYRERLDGKRWSAKDTLVGTCRNGHPWETSAYTKKNGDVFCIVCCHDRRAERRRLAAIFPDRVQPVEIRLIKRIDKTPGHGPWGDCWVYTGETRTQNGRNGYGQIKGNGQTFMTHRLAYEMEHGPIPEGLIILHKCDNPPCCNPAHLTAGTQLDNMRDMVAKGRGADMREVAKTRHNPAGERNGRARFTWNIVRAIRAEYAAGGVSQECLARKYGGNGGSICNIVNNKSWRESQ